MLLLLLRITGLLRPFSVPTGGMSPSITKGDHVMMEGVTFFARKPRRGDIVVFKTDGLPSVPENQIYVQRVVGLPGEQLRLWDGKLLVNEVPVSVVNETGEIHYASMPISTYLKSSNDTVNVPTDHYFLLGDNTMNSFDGRFYGVVLHASVEGRILLCYWPPKHVGLVK